MKHNTSLSLLLILILCISHRQSLADDLKPAMQSMELPVQQSRVIANQKVRDTQKLYPISIDRYFTSIFRFDTDLFQAASPLTLQSVRLSVGIQYIRRVDRKDNKPPLLVLLPLLKSITEYAPGQEGVSLKAGEDYDPTPLASVVLDDALKIRDNVEINIPIQGDPQALFKILNQGVVLKIKGQGPPAIVQINLFGPKTAYKDRIHHPKLHVQYTSQMSRLNLRPLVQIQDGQYVSRQGADFFYMGKPIRFFGLNIHGDAFMTYDAIDNYVNRLANMNINAVRLWATGHHFYTPKSIAKKRMVTSQKGDGSKTDLYDYLVYQLQQAGVFIHNTTLGSHGPDMSLWPGIKVSIVNSGKNMALDARFNVPPSILEYIDPQFVEVKSTHIELYLNRVNPYLNKRYAEIEAFASWELSNENHMVVKVLKGDWKKWPDEAQTVLRKQWNKYLKDHYLSTAQLKAAWGSLDAQEQLENNSIALTQAYGGDASISQARRSDMIQFTIGLFVTNAQRYMQTARSCAPSGVGINQAPILYNTHADLNLHAQYASSLGDFASCGVYSTPFTTQTDKPLYPWRPLFSERPYFYNLNFQTIKDKPFVIYEHSFFRPYPYRAEWSPAMALLGGGLGWDAIFSYFYGQAWGIGTDDGSDLGYLTKPLRMPPSVEHGGYTQGFYHANDEVFLASHALAAQAFINGITPNTDKVTVTFGQKALYNIAYAKYSPGGPRAAMPQRDLAGGEAEWYKIDQIYRRFMHTSVRSQLQLAFDPQLQVPIQVQGKLVNDAVMMDEDRQTLKPSADITWEPQRNRFVLDNAYSKIIVGLIRDGYTFRDGISLGPINRDFAMFGMASRDGKPLAESRDILITLISQSQNTDYKFDPSAIKGPTLGHIRGIVDVGRSPVVVDRVSGRITFPGYSGQLHAYNFANYRYRDQTVSRVITFTDTEPLYLARLIKP